MVDGVGGASTATYYVHTDHLHRPIRMSNAAKAFVWSAEYQPWGAVQSLSGALTLDLRFPGQWFQLEAGLHYNWHRHYDPSLGRYTQPDPLGFVDGPSVYGYAGGSPLQWVDPKGKYKDYLGRIVVVPDDIPPLPAGCGLAIVLTQYYCKVDNRCRGGGVDDCQTINHKINRRILCISSQKRVNICYGDHENANHGTRFQDEDRGIQDCINKGLSQQCYQCQPK